ncbi:hypothetical protein SOM12_23315 [Flavobacterium sp. CFBP9031]|uniref:hypothetical protein n=1 Tax=Flavobacterium sp. CFBP9031 TaxID=3096538 RepID=UPI002A69E91A|nr:hypothetical protein [Flavobacterium sp. CFBP9031]MDY0990377.1 hypothetical protein [Flavobacterium sp. CFBP9031]
MKNKVLSSLFILCCAFGYSQTNNKLGVNVKAPTESLDVNGTTRLRSLPLNGATNAITTKTDGTASTAKDQTYSAVKTVVVDANGVVGTIDGVAITTSPDIKTIQYARTSTPINAQTPLNSITTIGNLSIRFNSGSTGSANSIEFQTKVPNQVTAFGEVSGAGGNYFANWRTTAAAANTWYVATAQGVTPANRDTYNLMITLHNSQEIYRVSLICNAQINANTGLNIPIAPAQVIIFIEKLQ